MELREKITPHQYDTWLRAIRLAKLAPGAVELIVPNKFVREWVGKKYAPLICDSFRRLAGWQDVRLTMTLEPGVDDEAPTIAVKPSAERPAAPRLGARPEATLVLNRDYTFDNFVVGPHNQLAVAAARSIVDRGTRVYNPLFVYGRVGLGKTHLLQAICHGLLDRGTAKRIAYVSCEQFINQFIAAVEKGDLENFRGRYRLVDVLVVDDVHFLASKERSQEEFFHTFNSLHQLEKQIILSSDSPPIEIPTLSERLVSRFKQGMVCELEPPLFETRMQIASRKAEQLGRALPQDVLEFIAQSVQTNVRELEGAVTRILGKAILMDLDVTLAMARDALADLITDRRKRVTLDDLVATITEHFGVRRSDLQSKRRTKALAEPRQICMFLARKHTTHSLEEIGMYFGGRDHSTVLYGTDRVTARMAADPEFRRLVEELGQRPGGTTTG